MNLNSSFRLEKDSSLLQWYESELLNKEIPNRIKYLRLSKGITQKEFYDKTGIHVARIEQGRNISLRTVIQICGYFNITVHEFFRGL